jgi:hypothetical protein
MTMETKHVMIAVLVIEFVCGTAVAAGSGFD